jgi:A/G-specific adenine glycosylase
MDIGGYNASMPSELARDLLSWYRDHGRNLPWRQTRDPYAIWVAEVMLQQTRVETVIPYFKRWMGTFPTIETLAAADREEVLAQWEGLGYYRRAHLIHQAAQLVVQEHDRRLPDDPAELERLPGIGRYTAAAIAAIAFNLDSIALDGNLRRVLSRLIDLDQEPRSAQGEAKLLEAGKSYLPTGRGAAFNQALMDLGSLICRSAEPSCSQCPVAEHCLAKQRGTQAQRPLKRTKRRIPHHQVTAAVLRRNGKVLIGRRPQGKLLGGLWEFPGGKRDNEESLETCIRREIKEELGVEIEALDRIGAYDHAYTHFRVTVVAFGCKLIRGRPRAIEHEEILWAEISRLDQYPMGKVDRLIAKDLAAGQR